MNAEPLGIGDQPLTKEPPVAAHLAGVLIEKPVPLQAFRPLQEFAPPLQALWPLQALAAMHLPSAAYADVDPVETTAPARNRVAAAAASVAPDLESNFMTISSRIVDTENAMPSITEPHDEKPGCIVKSRGRPALLG